MYHGAGIQVIPSKNVLWAYFFFSVSLIHKVTGIDAFILLEDMFMKGSFIKKKNQE